MNLLDTLNPMQKEAVLTTEGALLLLAGAGSGTTRVLTTRIAHMIENGVQPFHIIAITFTNKAAKEMRERVNKLASRGDEVWVSTFHSTCVRILRREIENINYDNRFSIYDSSDTERIIKDILKQLNINDKQYKPKSIMAEISNQKNELIGPDQYAEISFDNFRNKTISAVYTEYQKRLHRNNALDFDDLIFKTIELFTSRPDILAKYQDRFRYVMVDEYQDTNTAQYNLVLLLGGKYKNVCVVGDDDQSIYGWRGANIRNILDFEKDFRDAKTIKLEQNYRSTSVILESANAVIKNNTVRKPKALWTENMGGEKITYYNAYSEHDEAYFVVNEIKKAVEAGKNYKDFAILYRTNAQSRVLEDNFFRQSIPYRLLGGVRFYERKEIKDLISYLKTIYNPADDVAIKRIINVPKRGIGDTTVERISTYANENDMSFFEALLNLDDIAELKSKPKKLADFIHMIHEFQTSEETLVALIERLLAETGYTAELMLESTDEALGRIENIKEFISKATEFENQAETKTLGAFLEEIALVADIDNYKEDDNAVVLMTLHSSKGLEFPSVFLSGFEEGLFPSYRSITDPEPNALEEERRLCYVGITRAKEKLYISAASSRMQRGETLYSAPSRFLKEIPVEFFDGSRGGKPATKVDKSPAKPSPLRPPTLGTPMQKTITAPQNVTIDFGVGDQVRQMKYGVGTVMDIKPAGADFEVTLQFENIGTKKFMANLSKLSKV